MKTTQINSRTFITAAITAVVIFMLSLNIYSQESSGEFDYTKSIHSTVLTVNMVNSAEIPADLFKLNSLEELTITGNEVTVIPVDIKKLILLRVLDLSGTRVDVLPVELSQLRHLQEIHLNYEVWQYRLDEVKKVTRAKIVLE